MNLFIFDIVFGICALIGVGLLIASYIVGVYKYRNCKTPVLAKCVKLKKQKIDHDYHEDYYPTFLPVYEYTYNGKTRIVKETVGTRYPDIKVGEEKEIFIDPDNPKIFNTSGKSPSIFLALAVPGFIFLISAIFVCVIMHVN